MMGHGGNALAIVVAAVAAWMFGAVYYGALGPKWIAAQGKTLEQCKAEQASKSKVAFFAPFVLSFIAEIVMSWATYGVLFHMNRFTVRAGMFSAAALWVGFVLTTIVVNNAYAGRKVMLSVIDSVHWLGVMLIIGAIVGWFGP
jgi:hypothetical protein